MAGIFFKGETKVRPGVYYNVTKLEDDTVAGEVNGVVGVLFRADFGPIGKVVEIDALEGYESFFGTTKGADAIKYAIRGGARKILAVRVGSGGTPSHIELEDEESKKIVKIEAKYPGVKEFSVTIRNNAIDESRLSDCIIYSGSKVIEEVTYERGNDEAASLVMALQNSIYFNAKKVIEEDNNTIKQCNQKEFITGTNPVENNDAYSKAMELIEAESFNTICLDTDDTQVQILLSNFLQRIESSGQFGMGVVAEKESVSLEDRMKHAKGYNDYKMHYVLNAHITESQEEIDGYQTAALIAGYIAAVPSSKSLTHTLLQGVGEIKEPLTPSVITKAQLSGCIVLSYSASKNVWIDSAINTLVEPDEAHDNGWKKIRRTKTRFELMNRLNNTAEEMVGKVDNDANGRTTILSKLSDVGNSMVIEGKLNSCIVEEDKSIPSNGDSVYLNVTVVDKDSAERIYLTFAFQFSTN